MEKGPVCAQNSIWEGVSQCRDEASDTQQCA